MATSKSTKTSSAKKATEAAKKSVAKAETAAVEIPKTVVATPKTVVAGPVLKKKELVDRVVARSGGKKKDVKPAVEAVLAVLGEALAKGEAMNLQPLGKIMIKNQIEKSNGNVLNCRIRQARPKDTTSSDPIVEAAE